jgi:hypothetical protein
MSGLEFDPFHRSASVREEDTMNLRALGQSGLTGWRRRAAQPVARVVARRSSMNEGQVLAIIGGAFLAMTLFGFVRTAMTTVRAARYEAA